MTVITPMASGDTPLERVLAFWLDGDDAQSLPMLAESAVARDVQVRLLLARIIHEPHNNPFFAISGFCIDYATQYNALAI